MVAGPARPSALRRLAAQLATLLWKNMLLKRRRWKATVAEIVLPLAVFAVAVWYVIDMSFLETRGGATDGGTVAVFMLVS